MTEADSFTGDPAERTKMYQEAEKVLVEDVGGVFVYHTTPGDLIKPYLKGPALEPDANGVSAWHWPYFSSDSDIPAGRVHHQRRDPVPPDAAAVGASATESVRSARFSSQNRADRTDPQNG